MKSNTNMSTIEIQFELIKIAQRNTEVSAFSAANKLGLEDNNLVNILLGELIDIRLLDSLDDMNNTGERVGMRNPKTLRISSLEDLPKLLL